MSISKPELSIVATVYNDASLVPSLVEKLIECTKPLNVDYEIILVDDASSDQSREAIQKVVHEHEQVIGIGLSRNRGQQIAMSAGIEKSRGQWVIILDGDLQNPPEEIPHLYQKAKEGYDCVYTTDTTRNGAVDEWTSKIFWFIINRFLKNNIVENQLMLRIMSRKFVNQFSEYKEYHRTIMGITHDVGLKSTSLPVQNRRRMEGASHYNFLSRMDVLLDIIVSTTSRPLTYLMYIGLFSLICSIPLLLYHLFNYVFLEIQPGFTSLIIVNIFFGGIITSMLGLIGRYLSNIYNEVRQRPLYFIEEEFHHSS